VAKGQVDGHLALFDRQTMKSAGTQTSHSAFQMVLAGTDVFTVCAFGATVPTHPPLGAATLALIARVEAAR